MSWTNKGPQAPTNPTARPSPVQMYNPNQENQWQQQNWYSKSQPEQKTTTDAKYWSQRHQNPPPQQQLQQQPQHHTYTPSSSQQYQEPPGYYQDNALYQHQQAYGNLQYNQQYGTQNNIYPAQPQQQTNTGDAWNWGWGDEDNSNVQAATPQPQTTNNVAESFANDESWNWSVEESNMKSRQQGPNRFSVKTDNSAEMIKPSPITGRKNRLETPQWSVESQMSQESSDDILQTSESDKSHILSRSSTISHSPISGQDLLPPNPLNDGHVKEEPNLLDNAVAYNFENKEILARNAQDVVESKSADATPPPPLMYPPKIGDDAVGNPYKRNAGFSHKTANKFKPAAAPPADSRPQHLFQPQPFNGQTVNLETLPDNAEQPDSVPSSVHNLTDRKTLSNSSSQHWAENNEAPINDRNQYLETGQLSDIDVNSSHNGQSADSGSQDVDTLPPPGLSRMVLGQLEQHESNAGGDGPPPGFRRMVPGQLESNSSNINGNNLLSDRQCFEHIEPPEGLRRMVPGESSSPESSLRQQAYQLAPPTGDRRQEMEDSETEFDEIGTQASNQPRSATIGADTPPVVPNLPTSSSNRSETIGADTSPDPPPKTSSSTSLANQDNGRVRGASASSGENRKVAVAGNSGGNASTLKKAKKPNQGHRRDSVEGQIRDDDLANAVRNLTVADNPSEEESNPDRKNVGRGRNSKQESSDSEHERRSKSPKDRRDRRYHEKDDQRGRDNKHRSRYSPDSYKDKRYDKRRYKDRRYQDDTDYLSDKEREKRHRDDDYERKYSSLRKDKDKRRRDDRRDDRREYEKDSRKNDYYYGRYEDYENESRSRASSRSDSMHEAYRERDRERGGHDRERRDRRQRDKERHRRHRDPFNPYAQGYAYDIYSQYYQQYQYYENLRKTNPQAYAQLYRKYYQGTSGETPSYGGEDRASVHSGRSSAHDELTKDRYTRQSYYSQTSLPHLGGYYRDSQIHSMSGQYGLDDSSFTRTFDHTDHSVGYEDSHLNPQRLTPAKFATAHIKASISSGKLVKILPHYPLDGQSATVELCTLGSLLRNDVDFQELKQFPGPLMKGTTHKKTIIEYCENKIKEATCNLDINDPDSYVLMWELLILLIRQNGMVVGTDIAELLLKNQKSLQRPSSVISSIDSNAAEAVLEGTPDLNSERSNLKEEDVTNKFREYLLYGSGKEALEWAMKHGLWGHALFLASKLDKRTYANVLMRFANGLTMNDPLQTLYQLLSGKVPAAVTCVADEKWGDWRPHLAMILSNSSQRPELNCKAITMLGDTLLARGSLYAAQFCYLMAEVGFSKYGNLEGRLVLLGSDHNKPFAHFATNEAIHMTEIYEYACSLNDDNFALAEFQRYKYLLATRLADVGLLEKALSYLEKIANFIVKHPVSLENSVVCEVATLADRLKYYDPVGDADEDAGFGINLDTSRPDNSWLKDLRAVQSEYNNVNSHLYENNLATVAPNVPSLNVDPNLGSAVSNSDAWQPQQQYGQYQQWTGEQQQAEQPQSDYQQQSVQQPEAYSGTQYQDQQQQYWLGQQQWVPDQGPGGYSQEPTVDPHQQNYYSSVAQSEPDDVDKEPPEDLSPPQISMPNQHKGQSTYSDDPLPTESTKKEPVVKSKAEEVALQKPTGNGWFGGIFSKLTLKPKNQIKLPDDKNPSIVWDPEKKRWINTDEDAGEGVSEFKPPPKMADVVMAKMQSSAATAPAPPGILQPEQNFATQVPFNNRAPTQPALITNQKTSDINDNQTKPALPAQPNMFKLQRSRNLKKSYIDVFNPNGGKSANNNPQAPTNIGAGAMGAMPAVTPPMNFFIPQPVNDPNAPTDFITQAPSMIQFNENSQLQGQ